MTKMTMFLSAALLYFSFIKWFKCENFALYLIIGLACGLASAYMSEQKQKNLKKVRKKG